MSEPKWLEISTVEDMKNKQQRIMHETTGEVRLIPPDELPDGLGPNCVLELEGEDWYVSIEESDGVRYLVFEGSYDHNPAMIPEDKWPDLYQFIGRLIGRERRNDG